MIPPPDRSPRRHLHASRAPARSRPARGPLARRLTAILAGLALGVAGCSDRGGTDGSLPHDKPPGAPWPRTESREACADHDPLRRPLFGDLHVHTRVSADAYIFGTRVGPRDAYAFARGAEIALSDDDEQQTRSARIDRPLDFTAVTDHAEFFGEVDLCAAPGSAVYDERLCEQLRAVEKPEDRFVVTVAWLYLAGIPDPPRSHTFCFLPGIDCDAAAVSVWREMQAAAEEAYDRSEACSFTSFVGYEHTASPVGRHMHRNVIFRNATVPAFPASQLETAAEGSPQGVWTAIETGCLNAGTGCDAVIIPHNSNLSGGRQLADPLDASDARRRQDREPLVEIFQLKSSSECRFDRLLGRGVGTEDELCSFEQRVNAHEGPDEPPPILDRYPRRNLVRNALKDGLALESTLGANPFQMGFIGSTDTHDGNAGDVGERDWPGAQGNTDASPARRIANNFDDNPGGLAVVWAEENSRDAIFEALRRRETYATSGPRPMVRFFAGPLDGVACDRGDAVRRAYETGVPMGGELGDVRSGRSPRFLVLASKDPGTPDAPGTDLQRAQIVKGWVDADGVTHEQVFDVASSGGSDAGVDPGTCEPVGRGASELCTVWEDPGFDPDQRAFYYVRLVENPTCRWSTLLCQSQGVDPFSPRCREQAAAVSPELAACCVAPESDPFVERIIQERAWTSPIWIEPDGLGALDGRIDAGGQPGRGTLDLDAELRAWPAVVDPTRDTLRIRVRDDESVLALSVPPDAWSEDGARRQAVVTPEGRGQSGPGASPPPSATVTLEVLASGARRLRVSAAGLDLSTVDLVDHEVTVELEGGVYRSTHRRRWRAHGEQLATVHGAEAGG